MASNGYEQLRLDPGIVKRRRASGCKCLLYTGVILCTLLGTIWIGRVVTAMANSARNPHSSIYENKTLAEVEDLSMVVRPLVDETQKFDIFATVWARDPGPRNLGGPFPFIQQEHPIFSDVLFQGVTLRDRHVHAKVNLSIPLESFEEPILENHDLRAAFTLVPQSPSLLDHMSNFTSWRPNELVFPKLHPDNPLLDERGLYQQSAIDSYGTSTPLIDFHPIKSSCVQRSASDVDLNVDDSNPKPVSPYFGRKVVSTRGKNPSGYHPYVVTRTDLRVVRMTKLYNRLAYNIQLISLSQNEARKDCKGGKDARECHRTFSQRANWETRFDLDMPDKDKTQYAYAPYMDVNALSWGPLDLVPMPIDREHCASDTSEKKETPKYLTVTWNVAFSASSPGEMALADILRFQIQHNTTDTEYNKHNAQQVASTFQRLHGHKFSHEAHAGRVFILGLVISILGFIRFNLNIHYWFTRSYTIGISIPGSAFLAASYVVLFLSSVVISANKNGGIFSSMTGLVMSLYWDISIAAVIVKTILHLEVVDYFPYWQVVPASHLERTSSRLEMRGRTQFLLAILAGVFIVPFLKPLSDFPLTARVGPKPDPLSSDLILMETLKTHVINPLIMASNIFQLILNHRSKTFAGEYKFGAYLGAVKCLTELSSYVPWVTGKMEIGNELTVIGLVPVFIMAGLAVQAVRYPKISQDMEDKDTN